MRLDAVQAVLSGMPDIAQIEDNLKTFAEEQQRIKMAAKIQHSAAAAACTACRYCCPDCPVGLDIPRLLRAYNDAKIGGVWRLSSLEMLSKKNCLWHVSSAVPAGSIVRRALTFRDI